MAMINEDLLNIGEYRDFEHLEFLAKQVVEGFITGLHKSPFHGFSVEFSEHRIYNPGESTRNIDWKLFGRTDRLYTKRYEEETNLRCRFMLDCSGSMFYPEEGMANVKEPTKILFSVIATLALMNLLKRQRDAIALSLFGSSDLQTESGSTIKHQKALSTELYKVLEGYHRGGQAKISLIDQLHLMAERTSRRSLLIIFSDFYEVQEQPEEFYSALQHLKHGKHEIIVFWTTDNRTEMDFKFESRPYKFIDIESGESFKLNPQDYRSAYVERMQTFKDELKQKCLQYKVDFVEADVRQGYHQVLQSYIIKRKIFS
mgnify:FL=1|tara:strand:- start:4304 stop:5248 length:945 start_codon:yes stop_codon:yes gene_type:complete